MAALQLPPLGSGEHELYRATVTTSPGIQVLILVTDRRIISAFENGTRQVVHQIALKTIVDITLQEDSKQLVVIQSNTTTTLIPSTHIQEVKALYDAVLRALIPYRS